MNTFAKHLAVLFLTVAAITGGQRAIAADAPADVTVFAAASLTNALEEIAKGYEATTGGKVKFSFAASPVLAKQLEAGAPAFQTGVEWPQSQCPKTSNDSAVDARV
jgi:molybdate transport system substrate-binding protein